jgi:pimeloyl-ACP methyl ester carboxylesterase
MAEDGRVGIRFLMWVVLMLFVGGIATVGFLLWKRPLTVDAWMSRLALRAAGLSSFELATPDGEMMVWEGGSGPTMVLLHGAGDQAGSWARIVRPLVETNHLLIPDLTGHWKSDPRRGPLDVDQLLAGVEAVMDSRCADGPAILVGNSLGAWLACLYARSHPDRVERVVAVNGGPLRNENPSANIFPADRDEAREAVRSLMGPNSLMPPGYVLDDVVRHARVGPAARLAATADRMATHFLDGRLHEVTVPVELVWGEEDGLLTVEYARRMLDGLPAARLHLVAGCGHVPQRECPDRVLRVMSGALQQPAPVPAALAADVEDEGEG